MSQVFRHQPVLLSETLEFLTPRPGSIVVDGTVGGGGHASAILERSGPDGRLIGLDVDDEALAAARDRLSGFGERVTLVRSSFRHLAGVLDEAGVEGVDGVLMDLGVSSHQLDVAERGFRFGGDTAEATPLDMRMDRRLPVRASDLLARASVEELTEIFETYGELRGGRRLARGIADARRRAPLRTSADLIGVVREARVGGGRKHHPATLAYQALRIAVNDELVALDEGLAAAVDALRVDGRLCVLAYHSLEDRAVKRALRSEVRGCICPPRDPVCRCGRRPRLRLLTRKPVTPAAEELADNPRARSARLRAATRVADPE